MNGLITLPAPGQEATCLAKARKRRRKRALPEETGQEVHNRVLAAHLGWGRLDPPDLADAVVLEVLRRKDELTLDGLQQEIIRLSAENQYPLFDTQQWCLEVRIDDLVERKLVTTESARYRLTRTGHSLFGDGNLSPQRGPRHVVDPSVYRTAQPIRKKEE